MAKTEGMIPDPRVAPLLEALKPMIVELDRYPRPMRENPANGAAEEVGNRGDQHCPTVEVATLDAILELEPFRSHDGYTHLRFLRDQAQNVRCREVPGSHLRRVYEQLEAGVPPVKG